MKYSFAWLLVVMSSGLALANEWYDKPLATLRYHIDRISVDTCNTTAPRNRLTCQFRFAELKLRVNELEELVATQALCPAGDGVCYQRAQERISRLFEDMDIERTELISEYRQLQTLGP